MDIPRGGCGVSTCLYLKGPKVQEDTVCEQWEAACSGRQSASGLPSLVNVGRRLGVTEIKESITDRGRRQCKVSSMPPQHCAVPHITLLYAVDIAVVKMKTREVP